MIKLYVHEMTIRHTDYGSPLETVTGVCWSIEGKRMFGFERGRTIAMALAIAVERPDLIEIVVGKPVVHTCDMNPHGSI